MEVLHLEKKSSQGLKCKNMPVSVCMSGLTTNQQHVKLNNFLHSDLNVNVNIAALEALEHRWYVNHAVVYI